MRIVYIAYSTIPSRTANSIHVMKMCQAFAQNGHDITLMIPALPKKQEQDIVDIFDFYGVDACFNIKNLPSLPTNIGGRLRFGYLSVKEAKKLSPDIIYSRDLVACYFASLYNFQVVFESHVAVCELSFGRLADLVFRKLIKMPSFKKLIVITNALKNYYLENYPIVSENILVAPDGADPTPKNVIPYDFPNKDTKLQVGYVGSLLQGRGIDLIYQLAERCSWADFHIIGGTDMDIHRFTNNTILHENLIFHGFKSPRETERYRIGCDVLIAPYQHRVSVFGNGKMTTERWMSPIKIFEYMSAGKAIISSDIPVLREVLRHNDNALLCSPDDINTWQEAICHLWNNRDEIHRLGEMAQIEFINTYTWQIRAERVIEKIFN